MENLFWLQMFGGAGFGSGVDLAAVVAFVVYAAANFLAPVVGYREKRPGGLGAAMYLLVAYVGVSIVLLVVQWYQLLDANPNRNDGFGPAPRGDLLPHLMVAGAVVKLVLFAVSMLVFAAGVRSLKLRPDAGERSKAEGW